MPYAVFPRTPGRDYAGFVIDGPADWIGREVFGSSGDLGIRRDGTHATHLVVEADAVVEKPREHFVGGGRRHRRALRHRDGRPAPRRHSESGETVLVMGVNGKVGQAAVQIASWHGARVIGVVRKSEPYEGHANSKVEVIDASVTDVAARVRELTDGKGADIVFNTVGDPYFEAAHKSLALRGRQILIAAVDRIVQFNILEFYRGQHTYVGIDTLGLSSIATGAVLRELGPGFASGHLKPFPIKPSAIYPLEAGQGRLHRGGRFVARPRDPAAGRLDGSIAAFFCAETKSFAFPARAQVLFSCLHRCDRFILCCAGPWTAMRGDRIARRNCNHIWA